MRGSARVDAVCTDMHRPYVNAVARELPEAEIVFDKECAAAHSLSYGESSEMCRVAVDLAQGARQTGGSGSVIAT
jgi:transposase